MILFFGILAAGLLFVTASTSARTMRMAWVLTLPAAICLSAGLYVLFSNLF